MRKGSELKYRLTYDQKKLLKNEQIDGKTGIKNHLKKIIHKNILIEKGVFDGKKDVLIEKDLYSTQVNYLIDFRDDKHYKAINKYYVANYYFLLAKEFNKIALKRKISRNELWNKIKKNIIIKDYNKSKQRLYKYLFRGEIIPSLKFVENTLNKYDDLPSYLCLIYLDEDISPELKYSYDSLLKNKLI